MYTFAQYLHFIFINFLDQKLGQKKPLKFLWLWHYMFL